MQCHVAQTFLTESSEISNQRSWKMLGAPAALKGGESWDAFGSRHPLASMKKLGRCLLYHSHLRQFQFR